MFLGIRIIINYVFELLYVKTRQKGKRFAEIRGLKACGEYLSLQITDN